MCTPHGVTPQLRDAANNNSRIEADNVALCCTLHYITCPGSEYVSKHWRLTIVIMATTSPSHPMAAKPSVERIDTISITEHPDKPPYLTELDKFGAHAKSDPAEIALVRKIDLYMLPILWLMYCAYAQIAAC